MEKLFSALLSTKSDQEIIIYKKVLARDMLHEPCHV